MQTQSFQGQRDNNKLTNIAQRALGKAWIHAEDSFISRDPDLIENALWLFAATTGDQTLINMFDLEASDIENEQQILNCSRGLTVSLDQCISKNVNTQLYKLYRKLYVKLLVLMKQRKYINFEDGYNPITEQDFNRMDGDDDDSDSVETG